VSSSLLPEKKMKKKRKKRKNKTFFKFWRVDDSHEVVRGDER